MIEICGTVIKQDISLCFKLLVPFPEKESHRHTVKGPDLISHITLGQFPAVKFLKRLPQFLFMVGKTDSLTILSRTVKYYTFFSKRLQPIIRYYSVCICCSSVAHHIILLHLIESSPQGLFPRICLNYVIIFLLLLFFSYR